MSGISTHILDTARGRPAVGVAVRLEREVEGRWLAAGEGLTDEDGRVAGLSADAGELVPGVYRLRFEVGPYFAGLGVEGFYPRVTVEFEVRDGFQHYHVPLLLSGFGYSTYRGS